MLAKGIMLGVSSYYEVVSDLLLSRFEADPQLRSAFASMWGYGSGMYAWFDQLTASEVAQITHKQEPAVVDELRQLLRAAEAFPHAYIEKTHEEHVAVLTMAFAESQVEQPGELAQSVVYGTRQWTLDTELSILPAEELGRLSNHLRRISVVEAVNRARHREKLSIEYYRDAVSRELTELVECYCVAADRTHSILIGFT